MSKVPQNESGLHKKTYHLNANESLQTSISLVKREPHPHPLYGLSVCVLHPSFRKSWICPGPHLHTGCLSCISTELLWGSHSFLHKLRSCKWPGLHLSIAKIMSPSCTYLVNNCLTYYLWSYHSQTEYEISMQSSDKSCLVLNLQLHLSPCQSESQFSSLFHRRKPCYKIDSYHQTHQA